MDFDYKFWLVLAVTAFGAYYAFQQVRLMEENAPAARTDSSNKSQTILAVGRNGHFARWKLVNIFCYTLSIANRQLQKPTCRMGMVYTEVDRAS